MMIPGGDSWLEEPAETECPECGAQDPRDCPCRDCTVCYQHESECLCGTEDSESDLLSTASWIYESTGADLDTCMNEAADLLAALGEGGDDDAA